MTALRRIGLRGTNIAISGIFLFVRIAGVALVGFVERSYLIEALLLVPPVLLMVRVGGENLRAPLWAAVCLTAAGGVLAHIILDQQPFHPRPKALRQGHQLHTREGGFGGGRPGGRLRDG